MTSSLVGSEMCIRDSHWQLLRGLPARRGGEEGQGHAACTRSGRSGTAPPRRPLVEVAVGGARCR
eukprot:8129547-Prorocentrum_lima.AAC.1